MLSTASKAALVAFARVVGIWLLSSFWDEWIIIIVNCNVLRPAMGAVHSWWFDEYYLIHERFQFLIGISLNLQPSINSYITPQ